MPIAAQQAQQANAAQNAAKDEARLVLALGFVEVNAVAENAQIHDDAEDVTDGAARLVGFLQLEVVYLEGDDNQCGINQIIGGFFGNHFSILIRASTAVT